MATTTPEIPEPIRTNEVFENKRFQCRIFLFCDASGWFIAHTDFWYHGQGGGDCGPYCEEQTGPFATREQALAVGAECIRRHIEYCHHWRLDAPQFRPVADWIARMKQATPALLNTEELRSMETGRERDEDQQTRRILSAALASRSARRMPSFETSPLFDRQQSLFGEL